jgi:hypothetical protein
MNVKLETSIKGPVTTMQKIAHVAPQIAAFEETALGELGKLVPPTELERDWKILLAGAQTIAENTSKIGEYAKVNSTFKDAKSLINSSASIQAQMLLIAKRDGLKECEQVA